MEKSVITVNIFGNEYTIKGVARPDYIISLANYLNNKMTEVQEATGLKDAKKIAILAAINISDELFESKKAMKDGFVPNDQLAAIRNRVEGLIAMIDQDLPRTQESPAKPASPEVQEQSQEIPGHDDDTPAENGSTDGTKDGTDGDDPQKI
jgi:cell division protein ZapA